MSEKEIKCVIWDLDETLWDGVLPESDDVRLKPGIVEIVRTLDERGILNSIASKNDHDRAAGVLRDLGLWEYFLYPQINWGAKSTSVETIQKRLNIGFDTLAFIDDQPFERDEVRTSHPSVLCIEAERYRELLRHPRLNPRFVSDDARRRRLMYIEDARRESAEESFHGPKREFLQSLNMELKIAEAQEGDLVRAAELTVRTNQLNSTGRTYDYETLDRLRQSDDHKLYVCELTDVYGSYGKIGLALVETRPEVHHLRLLLMSCRVMSRGAGSILLSYVMRCAKQAGARLLADFVPTDRNRMMYIAYKFGGFKEVSKADDGSVVLEADLSRQHNWPDYVRVRTGNE